MTRTIAALVAFAALAGGVVGGGGVGGAQTQEVETAADWKTFEASWSAAGHVQAIATEFERPAAILSISGAIVLTQGDGLARGFRGEALGFDDGHGQSVGRAVWTDDRGDRIFSRFTGEGVATGRRTVGTFTGGTGRYAGITGDYAITWKYVVRVDDGTAQATTVDFKGRFRRSGGQE